MLIPDKLTTMREKREERGCVREVERERGRGREKRRREERERECVCVCVWGGAREREGERETNKLDADTHETTAYIFEFVDDSS